MRTQGMSSEPLHNESKSTEPADPEKTAAEMNNTSESDSTASPKGRLGQFASESRELIEDLREWVDLRVELVQVDIEERIQAVANQMAAMLIATVFGLFTALFLLHGLSVLIGNALGNEAWGYLIIAAVLGVVTLVVHLAKPTLIRRPSKEATGGDDEPSGSLPAVAEPKKLMPGEEA